ncbi:MAG: GAF and ANTAR domain-containing protein [Actinomycetota bacterium]
MASDSREARLVETFVTLEDTIVASYDVVELLQKLVEACADILAASEAGILLAEPNGDLSVVASTSEHGRLVDVMQGGGPCVEAFTAGTVIDVENIEAAAATWPEFAVDSAELGFRSVTAIPMTLRSAVIGTLNLFRAEAGALGELDLAAARGLADVATIGILHERTLRESTVAREQLQHALDSRVVIEQAKGVICQLNDLDMGQAFALLRQYARRNNLAVREVAARIVNRGLRL